MQHDFDWVSARLAWNSTTAIARLAELAERDVQIFEMKGRGVHALQFRKGLEGFRVWDYSGRGVNVTLLKGQIVATYLAGHNPLPEVSATASLDDKGQPCLVVDGKQLLAWQFLSTVLGPVLFGD